MLAHKEFAAIDESRSMGDILGDLSRDATHLFRQEIALLRAELAESATKSSRDIASIVSGGLVAFTGALAITAAVILMLIHIGVAPWLAALLVGALLVLVGIGMARGGMARVKRIDFAPHRTIATLQDGSRWAKEPPR
ncbi:MAG: phage holin family protein [Gemmatimonadota bacterium]